MDIQDKVNKAMDPGASAAAAVQPTTVKAVSLLESEYFYPASNGYQAISVRAATKADADAIYAQRRRPVNPPETQAKVDDDKQTINQ